MEKKYPIEYNTDIPEARLKAEQFFDEEFAKLTDIARRHEVSQGKETWISCYMAGYNAATPQGIGWVKASEFKTNTPVYRPYRKKAMEDEGEYDYGEIYVTEDEGRIYFDIDNECSYEHQSDERWKDYEILDESHPQPGRDK